jgi:hypothetical protein
MMIRGVGNFLCVVVAVASLASLVACSSNGNGAVSPPPPPPNTSGPVVIFPGTVSVPLSGMVDFTAFLPGVPAAHFSWSVSGTGNGSINASSGVYTAPTSVPNPATATITATDTTTSKTGTATINITAAQGVAVSPAGIAVPAGTMQAFVASVGGVVVAPTWQVNGTPGGDAIHGLISASGVYTAPLSPPPGGVTTVTAVSGANVGTSAVTVVFSSSSFSGPYAFSYGGSDSGGPLAVAGRFTANSAAGTLNGLEDYNSLKIKTPAQAQTISGTFLVNPDGSGSATVTDPAIGGNDTWHFALTASTQGGASAHALLLRFDAAATGSGSMDQQNPAQLTLSAIVNNYAFELSGFDPGGKALQMVGKFRADGLGNIPVNFAVEDINDGGTNTEDLPDLTLHGTFFLDPMFPGTGRGILQLINTSAQFPGTFNFTFYMVDGARLKIVENDVNAFLAGSCFSAPNTNGTFANSLLKGNYPFVLGGGTSGGAPLAEGGIMAANGSGQVTGGVLDSNNNGSIALAQMLTASNYSVDPNLGRITLALALNSSTTLNFAAYSTSSGSLEIIELDADKSTSGVGFPQTSTGPFAGTFGLNLAGVTSGSKTFAGQNVLGTIQVNSSLNAISGAIDLNNAGSVTSGVPLETSNGTIITAADVNGRGTASLITSGTTFSVAYYVVNPATVLLLETDSSHVAVGNSIAQF